MFSDVTQGFSLFFPYISATIFFMLLVFTSMGIVFFFTHRKGHKSLDMPGPWGFPYIGCMYLFRWSTFPPKTLANLGRIYGAVYCLNLGSTNVVVVNSSESVKEVLYRKGSDFAGRPALFSFGLWGTEEESLMLKDYSLDFLNLKYKAEITMQGLLNEGEFLSARCLKAVESFNECFEHFALQNDAFDPEKSIKEVVADFVMDTVFGQSISRWFYHEARIVLEQASAAFTETTYVGACIDFVPLMRYFKRKTITKSTLQVSQLRAFVRKVYQLHQISLLQDRDLKISLAHCLRSGEKGHRTMSSSFENSSNLMMLDDDITVFLLADIMFCAYEKLSTSLRWCIARLSANKQLQCDIQLKLDEELDNEREVWTSRKLSLLAATVDETLRTSCIMPFGIPHKTTRDTTLNGYRIPKDTVVLLNLWNCCHDAKRFPNPQEFNPYRYFSRENDSNSNIKLASFCPFSGGERKCLGEQFSRKFLMTLIAGLLRTFELELVTPGPNTRLEGPYTVLTMRPKSYTISARKRS